MAMVYVIFSMILDSKYAVVNEVISSANGWFLLVNTSSNCAPGLCVLLGGAKELDYLQGFAE